MDSTILAKQAKNYWATHHNLSGRVVRDGHEHRWELARYILDTYRPESVLEFGCGSGRNLAVLKEVDPNLSLTGVDANAVSLESGRQHHPDIGFIYGDEQTLKAMKISHYDIVLTVSVLDHIPDPEWRTVYDDLKRIARKAVVLLEPALFIEINDNLVMQEVDFDCISIASAPYTYAHDYYSHDNDLRGIRRLPIELGGNWQNFGECYLLMECVK